MEQEEGIVCTVQSVFEKYGHTIEYSWDYDAGDEYSRVCDLDIKVVG